MLKITFINKNISEWLCDFVVLISIVWSFHDNVLHSVSDA